MDVGWELHLIFSFRVVVNHQIEMFISKPQIQFSLNAIELSVLHVVDLTVSWLSATEESSFKSI